MGVWHKRILGWDAGHYEEVSAREAISLIGAMYRLKPRPRYTRRMLDNGNIGIWMLTDGDLSKNV